MAKWTADQIPDQAGRTAIVTGANSGLGFATARELARHGARVIVTARSQEKAESASDTIAREIGDTMAEPRVLDLADLSSVRSFAQGVDAVDVLVNNAGVMMTPP
jgi:NAD(P)-dependent dehydrogenase (short-subunit alcohol dehydrogenase family)